MSFQGASGQFPVKYRLISLQFRKSIQIPEGSSHQIPPDPEARAPTTFQFTGFLAFRPDPPTKSRIGLETKRLHQPNQQKKEPIAQAQVFLMICPLPGNKLFVISLICLKGSKSFYPFASCDSPFSLSGLHFPAYANWNFYDTPALINLPTVHMCHNDTPALINLPTVHMCHNDTFGRRCSEQLREHVDCRAAV